MNIVSKVTWTYMKKNKKRTLVTIFGVIISVAMLTAVLTSITSFLRMFQQHEINVAGSWIADYGAMDKEKLKALESREEIDLVMNYGEVGWSAIEAPQQERRPYIYIQAVDPVYMEDHQFKLVEGRLPQTEDEIVLGTWLLQDMGDRYAVGDVLSMELGYREVKLQSGELLVLGTNDSYQAGDPGEDGDTGEYFVADGRKKDYTIVGFIEQPRNIMSWTPGYTAYTYMDTDQWPADRAFHTQVTFDKIHTEIYDLARSIAQDTGIDGGEIQMHDGLLQFYGVTADAGMNTFLKTFGGFLIVIIMVGSIMLIYNAFAISLSERSRQLGMLSSVGATRGQKRRSVFFEGAVIGCISIPLGIVAGIGGIAVTFRILEPVIRKAVGGETLRCVVEPATIILSVLFAALTIFISSWIPAVRAARISPIDSIRQSKDIKLTKRQVRTSRLTRWCFGFEGELALKNLKRNKKSYRITIISLVLSLVLFLSVAGYVTMLGRSMELSGNSSNFDVYAQCSEDSREGVDLCTSLEAADVSNVLVRNYASLYFTPEHTQQLMSDRYKEALDETMASMEMGIQFYGMTREGLERYVKESGLDPAILEAFLEKSAGDIPVILLNRYKVVTGSYEYADMVLADAEPGSVFPMSGVTWNSRDERVVEEDVLNIKVMSTTDKAPMGVSNESYLGSDMIAITLADHMETVNRRMEERDLGSFDNVVYVFMKSEDPQGLTEAVEELYENHRGKIVEYFSVWEQEETMRSLLLMIQVFSYGFITLMTLICTANILNTVSTGIELRRRELAMLKSVGMDPKAFRRMLVFESLFYGIKTLLYGIPIGALVILLEYKLVIGQFSFGFTFPVGYVIAAVVMIFAVVGISMAYSFRKIRKENILEGLRTE